MKIRQMSEEDIPKIRELISQGSPFVKVYNDYVYWMLGKYEEENCFLAEKDGKIVGILTSIVSLKRDCLFVWQVAVDKEERKQGIGGMLLSCAARRAKNYGLSALEFGVDPENKPCIQLIMRMTKEWGSQLKTMEEYRDQTFFEMVFRVLM